MRSRIIFAVALLAAIFTVNLAGSASAAPVNPNGAGAVRQAALPNAQGVVTGWHIQDGTIYSPELGEGMVDWFTTVYNGSVHESGLDAALKAKVNAPDIDTKGALVSKTFDPKVIQFIGGPYFDPARGFTTIGSFTLPAGTWLVNTSVKFTRTVAGVEGVRPQIGLRIGQGTASPNWGTDLGTVGGEDISKVANKDLWGQAVQSITLTEETTVGVYGHGYTDTQGTEGSNEISAAVQVFAQRG